MITSKNFLGLVMDVIGVQSIEQDVRKDKLVKDGRGQGGIAKKLPC